MQWFTNTEMTEMSYVYTTDINGRHMYLQNVSQTVIIQIMHCLDNFTAVCLLQEFSKTVFTSSNVLYIRTPIEEVVLREIQWNPRTSLLVIDSYCTRVRYAPTTFREYRQYLMAIIPNVLHSKVGICMKVPHNQTFYCVFLLP